MTDILSLVSAETGISRNDIVAHRRHHASLRARWIAMVVLRRAKGYSYPRIGLIMGGRDHSTVMHGIARIEALAERDPALRATIDRLVTLAQSQSAESPKPAKIFLEHIGQIT
jgi:chromosomal replication initiator protein